ncbi:MAG: DUF2254 domain-containing protein [Lacunisphaera sp.]
MRLQLIKIRDALANSFWFLPAVIACIAAGAAFGIVAVDHALGSEWADHTGWIWSGGADGARSVLSVIAGSVMTVVSIVFSLTITTLAQTSSHYGPRVLRNFTSDKGVQFTLGTFIATFVYCLLVLRTVRSVQESGFVPYLAVNVGVVLAVASLGVLIYFIHHVSQGIQAENLIAAVGRDFEAALPGLFPEGMGKKDQSDDAPDHGEWLAGRVVATKTSGYLQRVDEIQLMAIAIKFDLQIKLEKRPGDFAANGSTLLSALPTGNVTNLAEDALRGCYSFGENRTPHQDSRYSLQQLVEIATHALSPGINEPFTALTCIDWIGASLRGVAGREMPVAERCDEEGRLRVVAPPVSFGELARTSFDQIRLYGTSNPDIAIALLTMIAGLAPCLRRAKDTDVLVLHAQLIGADARQIKNASDRQRVEEQLQRTLMALADPAAGRPSVPMVSKSG